MDFDLVDPELRPMLDAFPALDISTERLPQLRQGLAAGLASLPANPMVDCEELRVDGAPGAPPVRLLVYRPRDKAARSGGGVLDIHGGGYVIGTPDMMRPVHEALVQDLGCVVVAVDYRLAPETPHPGPLDDCYAALRWFHAHADTLGVDRRRIGVTGLSAGGGLAAALALYVRDRDEKLLAFQHLIYPMIDDRTCVRDGSPHFGRYIWTPSDNRFGWAALLAGPPGAADVSPYAAPSRAEDLSNLPPTYIAVGALDLFLQEDLEYASRLAAAGVAIEVHVYPGAFHAFQNAPEARVSKIAERDSREALAIFLR